MKQLESRKMAGQVAVMAWSPKMDILALGMEKTGTVNLYRLEWQRVWAFDPNDSPTWTTGSGGSKKEVVVDHIAFHPSGQMVCAAYNHPLTLILVWSLDSEIPIFVKHYKDCVAKISTVNWFYRRPDIDRESCQRVERDTNGGTFDRISFLLSDIATQVRLADESDQSLEDRLFNVYSTGEHHSRHESNAVSFYKHLAGVQDLRAESLTSDMDSSLDTHSVLVIAVDDRLDVLFNGYLSCGYAKDMGQRVHCVSHLGNSFAVISSSSSGRSAINLVDHKLAETRVPLSDLCSTYRLIISLTHIIADVISAISDAWTDVWTEVDGRLDKIRAKSGGRSVASVLTELLAYGSASPAIQPVVIAVFGANNANRLQQNIQSLHESIRKLTDHRLVPLCQALTTTFSRLQVSPAYQNGDMDNFINNHVKQCVQAVDMLWTSCVQLTSDMDIWQAELNAFISWLQAESKALDSHVVAREGGNAESLYCLTADEVKFIASFISRLEVEEEEDIGVVQAAIDDQLDAQIGSGWNFTVPTETPAPNNRTATNPFRNRRQRFNSTLSQLLDIPAVGDGDDVFNVVKISAANLRLQTAVRQLCKAFDTELAGLLSELVFTKTVELASFDAQIKTSRLLSVPQFDSFGRLDRFAVHCAILNTDNRMLLLQVFNPKTIRHVWVDPVESHVLQDCHFYTEESLIVLVDGGNAGQSVLEIAISDLLRTENRDVIDSSDLNVGPTNRIDAEAAQVRLSVDTTSPDEEMSINAIEVSAARKVCSLVWQQSRPTKSSKSASHFLRIYDLVAMILDDSCAE